MAPNLPVAVLLGRDTYEGNSEVEPENPRGLVAVARSQAEREDSEQKKREEAMAEPPECLDEDEAIVHNPESAVSNGGGRMLLLLRVGKARWRMMVQRHSLLVCLHNRYSSLSLY